MNKLLVAAVAVGAITAFNLAPQPAQARDCSMVTATARGVTQGIATERADRRLNRYVTSNLSGWAFEPVPAIPARVGGLKVSVQLAKARP